MNPHQHRIIQCKLEGATAKEIAEKFKVKEVTIKYHLTAIYKILGCSGGRGLERVYLQYRRDKGLSEPKEIRELDGRVYRLAF